MSIEVLTFTRPSRTSEHLMHVLHFDPGTFTPIDPEHPCSCHAGTKGYFCHALLSVLSGDAPALVPLHSPHRALILERARIAGELLTERNRPRRRMH